jgi:5-methylcytosine-specific restriction protein B
MALPSNITKEHLIKAIEKIDAEGIPTDADSQYYDVVYNGKNYPPKVIVSFANIFANGEEINRNSFSGGLETKCFKLLQKNGFVIIKKNKMSYYNELKKFIVVSDKQVTGQGTVGVQEFNQERELIYNNLKVEVKFGTGRASAIPWIAFLSENDTVQNGIYPVYLYFKEKGIIILAYGVSETKEPNRTWNLQKGIKINEYFLNNYNNKPEKYGNSFVYKVYDLKKKLEEKEVNEDLDALIAIYKSTLLNSKPIQGETALKNKTIKKRFFNQIAFDINSFHLKTGEAGLIFSTQLIQRFVASLCTKPFVICSGLSGSGKTKLAQAFAQWIAADKTQYLIVPVGADWTNREPLLGYPNALNKEEYVSPENGVLDLMIRAKQNIENIEESTKPYFLILDEMNLSHVERYFADFLSTMESGDKIPLHKIQEESKGIPQTINLPTNLFIIGTVNIDETTYMFSPKVLDRANTIEFRLTEKDLEDFIASNTKLDMDLLKAQGANMSESFMEMVLQETDKNFETSKGDLILFFSELKKSGAEFGYRTASEIGRLMYMLKEIGESGDNLLDIAIMQKLLPKLHGSRNKLTKVLPVLGGFCLIDNSKIKEDYLDKFVSNSLTEVDLKTDTNIKYKISFEKICRMYKNAVENGFASYAEA